jgi:serine acetyltransferase
MRFSKAAYQLECLREEYNILVNGKPYRYFSVLIGGSFLAIMGYRIDRMLFLLLGNSYRVLRVLLLPLIFITSPWRPRCEIHYMADIGKGLRILHPSLGIVINGKAVVGDNLLLVGGNCIGARKTVKQGDILIGNNVTLGINSMILGPIVIGDNVNIGAGAVVVKDAKPNSVLVGSAANVLLPKDENIH